MDYKIWICGKTLVSLFGWIEKFQNWYFLKKAEICLFLVKEAEAGYKVITHVNPIDGSITVQSPGKQLHGLID